METPGVGDGRPSVPGTLALEMEYFQKLARSSLVASRTALRASRDDPASEGSM
ncbi:18906_t:CDS:2, partial [Rhizophagus irregularis]